MTGVATVKATHLVVTDPYRPDSADCECGWGVREANYCLRFASIHQHIADAYREAAGHPLAT